MPSGTRAMPRRNRRQWQATTTEACRRDGAGHAAAGERITWRLGNNPAAHNQAIHTETATMNTASSAKQIECDLLVIGSGAGGLSTAITARKHGLDVVVIEKEEYFGGTTAFSG